MTKQKIFRTVLLVEKTNFTNLVKNIFNKTLDKSFKKKIIFIKSSKDLEKVNKLKKTDYLFNFQHRIIKEKILKNIKFPVNFHPGSSSFPGRGGYVWAIYKKSKYYGCVAHIMKKNVDSGKIIEEIKFYIDNFDNIESLKFKCFLINLKIFYSILVKLNFNKKLSYTNIKWKRIPFKLADIGKINFFYKNSPESLKKLIIRATEHYPFGPYLLDEGKKIQLKIKKKKHIF